MGPRVVATVTLVEDEFEFNPGDARVHRIWREPDHFSVVTVCGRMRTREQATGFPTCLECVAMWQDYLRWVVEATT